MYGPTGYFAEDAVTLRARKADPMASTVLLGLQAFGIEESEPSGWFSTECTSSMCLVRCFRDEGSTSKDLMSRLAAYAQEQGWTADPDLLPSLWTGSRPGPLKGSRIRLSITRYPEAPSSDPLYTLVLVELLY